MDRRRPSKVDGVVEPTYLGRVSRRETRRVIPPRVLFPGVACPTLGHFPSRADTYPPIHYRLLSNEFSIQVSRLTSVCAHFRFHEQFKQPARNGAGAATYLSSTLLRSSDGTAT